MSVGYCRKCKMIFPREGICTCGRTLNSAEEQEVEMFLDHGYTMYRPSRSEGSGEDSPIFSSPTSEERETDIWEERNARKEEKRRQREEIKAYEIGVPIDVKKDGFDTETFLASLDLRKKK